MNNKIILLFLFLSHISLHAGRGEICFPQSVEPQRRYEMPSPEEFRYRALRLLESNVDLNAPHRLFLNQAPLLRLSYYNECAEVIEKLLQKGANPNFSSISGFPLDSAITSKSVAVVKVLLQYKADPNIKGSGSDNRLYNSLLDTCSSASINNAKEIVRLLIAHNCDLNASDSIFGETALMFLVRKPRCSDFCRLSDKDKKYYIGLLLYYGADTTLKNKEGKTAVELAAQNKLQEFDTLIKKSHKPLVNKLTRLLSHTGSRGVGKAPFPADVARIIAEFRYCNTGT